MHTASSSLSPLSNSLTPGFTWGGGHSEEAGHHNFLFFLSIIKILKFCVNEKPPHHKAKLSNNWDGYFGLLVVEFFCSIFKNKNDFFFKNEQKKLGNYKNKHTIRIVGRFHGVLTRAEPNPYKNRVAE
jgi:hypothetical protein